MIIRMTEQIGIGNFGDHEDGRRDKVRNQSVYNVMRDIDDPQTDAAHDAVEGRQ